MLCPRCTGNYAHELHQLTSGALYCSRAFTTTDGHRSDAGATFEWEGHEGQYELTQKTGVTGIPMSQSAPTTTKRHVPTTSKRSTNMRADTK